MRTSRLRVGRAGKRIRCGGKTLSATARIVPPASRSAAALQSLVTGPILAPLLWLAAPNVLVTAVYAVVQGVDAYYVGRLGSDALAAISLVFPMAMLMQTMSVGAMGGGIASAVARALGGGDRNKASALAAHGILVGAALGALFALGMHAGARALYEWMGGRGAPVEIALDYSDILFGAAILLCVFQSLAATLRGAGNMSLPAAVLIGGELLYVAFAPALIFGAGPIPALGVRGAAALVVAVYVVRIAILLGYFRSPGCPVRLEPGAFRIRPALFYEILRVSVPASVSTLATNLSILAVTAFAGVFGAQALAGYGMGARLEYMLAPIVFGFGSALVTMVGANVGAGQEARARRVAWTGTAIASLLTGSVGLICATLPESYMSLFTSDPAVMAVGAKYLRTVGPVYFFYGVGVSLFFASQGAGRPGLPLLGSVVRLVLTAGGGAVAVYGLRLDIDALFLVVATAFVVYGSLVAIAVQTRTWNLPR
jgi:putative MATE family efflux protein